MRLIALAAAATLAAMPALAGSDGMVQKTSPHDVPTTVDRLEAAFEGTNIGVIARIDHAANAAGTEMELRPTTLLIFGNPAHGTELMQASQTIGLDLPMRVLVYEDADGTTHLVYPELGELAERHGIDQDHEMIKRMTGGLDKFTDQATAQ